MPLAWSYARTSTVRQAAADRSGMERQAQALQHWLAAHPDYQLAEALVDAGVSAGKGRHRTGGALARFIAGGRTGTVPPGSCLVVESMSRFSREVATTVLLTLLRDVWGQGLAISFCTDGVVLDQALIDREDHRLHALIGAIGQARREWEEKSRRSQGSWDSRKRRQEAGQRTAAFTPWWIQRDDAGRLVWDKGGGFVINPVAAATIHRAVDLSVGGLGAGLIAERLNQEHRPPPHPGRRRSQHGPAREEWNATKVHALLRSPALVGTLARGDGSRVEGYYPPLLTLERWQQLRQAMEGRQRRRGSLRSGGGAIRNLFQIASRCAVCGAPMTFHSRSTRTRPGHPGYICCRSGLRRTGRSCTATRMIQYDHFETHCLLRLRFADWESLLQRPEDHHELRELEAAAATAQADAAGIRSRLEKAQERHADDWEQGAPTERLEAGERRVGQLREQLAAAEQVCAEAVGRLAAARARPSADHLGAVIQQRVMEFRQHIGTATGEERRDFNRWLLSLSPEVHFLVATEPAPGVVSVGLQVGDQPPVWQAIQPAAEAEAMRHGFIRYLQGDGPLQDEQQVIERMAAIHGGDATRWIEGEIQRLAADAEKMFDQAEDRSRWIKEETQKLRELGEKMRTTFWTTKVERTPLA
ncbi:MAG: recombinase family protein [Cyanobacteria bacterium J06638_7]